MAKIHINSKGEPGVCSAENGKCPFGEGDNHFATPEEASKAYGQAQEAMGNSSFGQHTGSLEDRFSYAETKTEAEKIANLISNEGKYAAIVTYKRQMLLGAPDFDSYDDEDDFREALDEFRDSAREGDVELEAPYSEHYQVRAFDTFEDAQNADEDLWNPKRGSIDIPVDVYDDSEVASNSELDDYNEIMDTVEVEFRKPKK